MIPRTAARRILNLSKQLPDVRSFFEDDPRQFLEQYRKGAVFDEAQHVPSLFSYLQEIIDRSDKRGRFILTGSNNFLLNEKISQSLAGRIAYCELLPLSIEELTADGYHYECHDLMCCLCNSG